MAAPTQLGTALEVCIGDYLYTGYFVQEAALSPTGVERIVRDENGATATVLISDKGKKLKMSGIVKSGSDPYSIEIGDTVTVNSVNYRITSADPVRKAGEEMAFSFEAVKEDSMTYT